jgi:hypothetical protein
LHTLQHLLLVVLLVLLLLHQLLLWFLCTGTGAAVPDAVGSKRDRQEDAAPYISTPMCGCGAGPCNVMKDQNGRMYFACPDDVSRAAFIGRGSG